MNPKQANRLDLHSPILKPAQMEALKKMNFRGWETKARAPPTPPCLASCTHSLPQSTRLIAGLCPAKRRLQDKRVMLPSGGLPTQAPACETHPACPPYPTPTHMQVIDITWPVAQGKGGLVEALSRIATEAAQAIDDGFDFVVLSDRAAGEPGPAPELRSARPRRALHDNVAKVSHAHMHT